MSEERKPIELAERKRMLRLFGAYIAAMAAVMLVGGLINPLMGALQFIAGGTFFAMSFAKPNPGIMDEKQP
jgi:hypothetical protein